MIHKNSNLKELEIIKTIIVALTNINFTFTFGSQKGLNEIILQYPLGISEKTIILLGNELK